MAYETIAWDLGSHGVLTITLDRPDRLNAYTIQMQQELCAAFAAASRDDDVRAIVLTGRGRAFCAGADLEGGGSTFDVDGAGGPGPEDYRDAGGLLTLAMFECTKPIIAAVNGAAVGVGATMLTAADVRLAGESARFGFVFTRRGLVPEACSSWFLPRIVGISQALAWCYPGRLFDAAEALRGGLVREVVPDEALLDRATALAADLTAETSAVSVALTRQLLWRMLGAAHPADAFRLDSQAIWWLGRGPDVREGVEAFLEKRAPQFTARVSTDLPPFVPWWDAPWWEDA